VELSEIKRKSLQTNTVYKKKTSPSPFIDQNSNSLPIQAGMHIRKTSIECKGREKKMQKTGT
jgi:hypothetical protein